MGIRHMLVKRWPCAFAVALISVPVAAVANEDLGAAKREFQTYCSPCHASDGKGRGNLPAQLKTPPPDLTKLSRRAGGSFPAEQVSAKIEGLDMPAAHGTSQMPVWSNWFVQEELEGSTDLSDADKAARNTNARIARLVKYLESIQD